MGYIVAPQQLIEPMIKIRAVMDQHSPAIDQATLARFLAEGFFLTHIKRMRKLYSDRRDFFIEQFNKLLGSYFILEIPEAGLHFVAWVRQKEHMRLISAGSLVRAQSGPLHFRISLFDSAQLRFFRLAIRPFAAAAL